MWFCGAASCKATHKVPCIKVDGYFIPSSKESLDISFTTAVTACLLEYWWWNTCQFIVTDNPWSHGAEPTSLTYCEDADEDLSKFVAYISCPWCCSSSSAYQHSCNLESKTKEDSAKCWCALTSSSLVKASLQLTVSNQATFGTEGLESGSSNVWGSSSFFSLACTNIWQSVVTKPHYVAHSVFSVTELSCFLNHVVSIIWQPSCHMRNYMLWW